MDAYNELSFLKERRHWLDNQLERCLLMEEAIHKNDSILLGKLKRDFEHVNNKMGYIEKRQ